VLSVYKIRGAILFLKHGVPLVCGQSHPNLIDTHLTLYTHTYETEGGKFGCAAGENEPLRLPHAPSRRASGLGNWLQRVSSVAVERMKQLEELKLQKNLHRVVSHFM